MILRPLPRTLVKFAKLRPRLTESFSTTAWWYFMPGSTIKVVWPYGPVEQSGDWAASLTASADPNYHYRPWLEKHVGKQGWDWDWRLSGEDLNIKFRRGKTQFASIVGLMWS